MIELEITAQEAKQILTENWYLKKIKSNFIIYINFDGMELWGNCIEDEELRREEDLTTLLNNLVNICVYPKNSETYYKIK